MSCREVLVVLMLLSISNANSDPSDEEATQNNKITSFHAADSSVYVCPREHYNFIRRENENPADFTFAKVDEVVSFKCNPHGDKFIAHYELNPTQYFVYPTSNRRCLSNGTWDGVPPMCAWKHAEFSHITAKNATGVYSKGQLCSNESTICVQAREEWIRIGELYSSVRTASYSSVKRMDFVKEIVYTFSQHIHLSFMAFDLQVDHDARYAGYDVEVKVPPQSIIQNLSAQSLDLLRNHGEQWLKKANLTKESAVTNITAYTNFVFVRYRHQKPAKQLDFKWKTKAKFFPIPRFDHKSLELKDSANIRYCPDRPDAFANATISKEASDKTSFIIACDAGFKIRDPVTGERFDCKNVTCLGNLEWSPYPFPVCLPEDEKNDKEANGKLRPPLPEDDILKNARQFYVLSNAELLELLNFAKLFRDSRIDSFEISIRLFNESANSTTKHSINWMFSENNTNNNRELHKSNNGEKNTFNEASNNSKDGNNLSSESSDSNRKKDVEINETKQTDATSTSSATCCCDSNISAWNIIDMIYRLVVVICLPTFVGFFISFTLEFRKWAASGYRTPGYSPDNV